MSTTFQKVLAMSQEEQAKYFPTFINNSGLPINLETLQQETTNTVLVKSGEKIVLPSTTGEWYLQTFLTNSFADEWKAAKINPGDQIGKFRNKSCVSGDYSWMDNERFKIIYDPENYTATFSEAPLLSEAPLVLRAKL
jgi:hypothetical protein